MFTLIGSPGAKKACSLFMSVVLAVGLMVPSAAFADKGTTTIESTDAVGGSEQASVPVDITSEWNKGALQITRGGTYYLSDDVKTTGSLTVSIPYGEEAVIDLRGHDAVVAGVVSSGIDVSKSAGSVTITDTQADPNAKSGHRSSLSIQANKAGEVTCGILANFDSAGTEDRLPPSLTVSNVDVTASVNTVDAASGAALFDTYGVYAGYSSSNDADKAIDLDVQDCSIAAALNVVDVDTDKAAELQKVYGEKVLTKEISGLAAGLFLANKGAALYGAVDASGNSQNESTGIYLKDDATFQVGSDFNSDGILVYGAKVVGGNAFALLQGEAPEEVESLFGYSMAPESYKCAVNGSSLMFEQQEAAIDAEVPFATVNEEAVAPASDSDSGEEVASAIEVTSFDDLKAKLEATGTEKTTIKLVNDIEGGGSVGVQKADSCIDLNGHKLTLSNATTLNLKSAVKALELTDSSGKQGVIEGKDGGYLVVTNPTKASSSKEFSMSNIALKSSHSKSDALRETDLGFFANNPSGNNYSCAMWVNALYGKVSIDNCSIEFDASNLNQFHYDGERDVAALLIGGSGKTGGTAVEVLNSSFVCKAPTEIISPASKIVNSNGAFLYGNDSTTPSVNFEEVSFNSSSAVGSANGITCGNLYSNKTADQKNKKNVVIGGSASFGLESSSGDAYGIRSLRKWSDLSGILTINASIDYSAKCSGSSAFLRALGVKADSVLLGSQFVSKSGALPLFIGADDDEANAGGSPVFGFMDGFIPTKDQLAAYGNSFRSYSDEAAGVSADENGVTFNGYTAENGAAYIVKQGGSQQYYRNFYQASKAVSNGETIYLNPNVAGSDVIAFQKTTEESSSSDLGSLKYTVDLNGVSVKEFRCASGAKVTLKSSAEGGQVLTGADDGGYATAISMTGSGELVLDPSVSVDVEGSTSIHAVSVTGGTFSASTSNLLSLIAGDASSAAAAIKVSGKNGADAFGVYAGMNATVNLTGITVEAESSNGTVNGVYLSANSAASLNGSAVTASGSDITKTYAGVAGIYAAGTGDVTATNSTITAENKDSSVSPKYSAGVYMAGKNVSLGNCTVEEQSSGSSMPLSEAGVYAYSGSLGLAGECGITSSADHSDIVGLNNALELSSGFASRNNKVLGVQLASGFSGDFAKRPSGDTTGFDDTQKNLFSVMLDGEAQGLRINDATNVLELDRDLVAKIGSTPYYTLSKAISSAKDDETISLEGDWTILTSKESLDFTSSAARNITLNLNGKTLSVTGSSQGFSTSTDAVIVPASGGLTVTDSAKSGKLVLNSANRGFRVGAGSSLVLDGAKVEVQCNGKVNYVYGGTQGTIVGIGSDGTAWKNVALQNGANLTVSSMGASALSGGFTGATQAYGIALPSGAVDSTSSSVLSIDGSSFVNVKNSSALFTAGSVGSGTEDAKLANLREVNLNEDSELYNSIWGEFFKSAKYDSTRGIYYAAPVKVNGVNYWVVSDKVENPKGTKDEVKPGKIYQRATYQVAPAATGIYSGNALSSATLYNGTVNVFGTVSVVSQNGNAYAVEAGDSATWNINGATLSAQSKATSAYRGKSEENHELYPGSQNTEIVDVAPQAAALKTGNSEQNFVLDGLVDVSSSIAFKGTASEEVNCASADIIADSVTCGSSFSLKEGVDAISVLAINGKNEKGSAFAKAAAEGTLLSDVAGMFEDATGTYGSVAATDGSLVWGGSYTVQFVDAYGNVVSEMAEVTDGTTVALPDANKLFRDRDGVYVYTFLGWSTKKDATEASVSAESATMQFASGGVAEQTITYYPVYSAAHYQAEVGFKNLRSADGTVNDAAVTLNTGKTVKEAINEGSLALNYATSYEKDGKKYVFVGWDASGAGAMDVSGTYGNYGYSDMRGGCLDDSTMRDLKLSDNVTFTARYVELDSSSQYLAKFKVGNIVFAYAATAGIAPSWANAGYKLNTGNLSYPFGQLLTDIKPEGVSDLSFTGWHSGYSDSLTVPSGQTVDYAKDATLAGTQAGGTVMYTAWFDTISSTYAVKLYLYQQGADGKFAFPRTAYSTNGSGYCSATYGTEPSSLVKDLPKSFVQDGQTYSFKGWSVRETDKEPIWEDGNLPKVTGDATYYAVYEESEQKVNVTFMNGSDTHREVEGVEVSKSLDDLAVENPQAADANQEFKGWSTQPGATSGMNASASLQELLGTSLTADTTQVTFYAIYGEKSSYQVTMHYQYLGEAKTLTAKAYDDGTVVLPGDFSYENAAVHGMYLAGWATAEGAAEPNFDLSKNKVSGDTALYAVYKDISVNATQGDGASIDATNAYVATQGAIGAQEVVAKVVKADSIDKNLSSKATGLLNRGNYTVSLGYSTGSESSTTQVNGSFGNLSISIPVASEDADRNFQVYWIQENGTFGGLSTSDSTQADKKISVTDDGQGGKVLKFSIGSYGDSMFGGNLMVCAEKTSLERAQDTYLSKLKEYWNKLGGDNEEDGIQDNYTDDDFAKLKQAYENGEKAIKAAADEDAALAAANEAVANLLAVPTRSTLQNAKAYALDKLADEFSGYNKSNYTEANWSQLEAAYKAAKENINNAATANDANSACNKGISAMASVSTNAASSGSSTSSGSSSGSGSGLASSTASGSGSGLSSSSGSGLSGSSGSGLESSSGSGLTSLGSTVQQMLGAKYETVTSDLVSQKSLIATSGVYVNEVTDGGAAQKAGLEVGDVITAVNGTQVSSVEELESVLADVKAGDAVEFTVDRNGKKLTLTATMDDVSSVSGLSSSSSGLGSSAYGSDADNAADALKVLRDYLPWIVLGLLVLLAAVAGLVWWLLRRRNNGSEEGLDETEGEADSQEDVNTFQF